MFDFAWSEIALIGVVALVAIGPKDMPVAIKAISDTIKKMRRMAGEFQGHVDEMLKEANLGEVKSTFDELRGMNVKSAMRRAMDPDGALKSAFSDPFLEHPVRKVVTKLDQPMGEQPVGTHAPEVVPPAAPAFIPPNATPPAAIQPAPAFIPPGAPQDRV
jgi:sec-independent protein translocase protein TatB